MIKAFSIALLLSLGVLAGIPAIEAEDRSPDPTDKSGERLMGMELTSAARARQKLSETAAAAYVITQEDIRRSGMTSIPELLRLVPGLNVAQINASQWAISARGLNSRFAGEILVMIDGRIVYSPLLSGVFWDVQDTVLEDIDRIEVVRGPMAALWGANAVNGIINIITKKASDTLGGMIASGYGNQEQGWGAVRYGRSLGQSIFARAYAKYLSRNDSANALGEDAFDNWNILRGGSHLDWQPTTQDALTFQGDVFGGHENQIYPRLTPVPPYFGTLPSRTPVSGGNILGRWGRALNDHSDISLQAFYDRSERNDLVIGETRATSDLDFQYHVETGRYHDFTGGLGYRYTRGQIGSSLGTLMPTEDHGDSLYSGFVQDEINLIRDRLRLTLGARMEHNVYTGFEVNPALRLLWTPHKRRTFWASISRAAIVPSRLETMGQIDLEVFPGNPLPVVATISGNLNLQAGSLKAYEAGFRMGTTTRFFIDVAAYYNVYQHLVRLEPEPPRVAQDPPPAHIQALFVTRSELKGDMAGAELSASWSATKQWRVIPGYTWTIAHWTPADAGRNALGLSLFADSPRHQAQVRSQLDLPHAMEFDITAFRISGIPHKAVPGYTRVDARLGWSVRPKLGLDLVLQNLQDLQHPEFITLFGSQATEVRRSICGKVTWSF